MAWCCQRRCHTHSVHSTALSAGCRQAEIGCEQSKFQRVLTVWAPCIPPLPSGEGSASNQYPSSPIRNGRCLTVGRDNLTIGWSIGAHSNNQCFALFQSNYCLPEDTRGRQVFPDVANESLEALAVTLRERDVARVAFTLVPAENTEHT